MDKNVNVDSAELRKTATEINTLLEGVKKANGVTRNGIEEVTNNWVDENGQNYKERYDNELAVYLETLEKDVAAMNELLVQTANDYDKLHEEDATAVGR